MNERRKDHVAKRQGDLETLNTVRIGEVSEREDVMMGMGQVCHVTVNASGTGAFEAVEVRVQVRPVYDEPPIAEETIDDIMWFGTPAEQNDDGTWIARNVPDFMCGNNNWVYAAAVFEDPDTPGDQQRMAAVHGENALQECSGFCAKYPMVEELPPENLERSGTNGSETSASVKPSYKFTLASDPADDQGDLTKLDQGHRLVKKRGFGCFLKLGKVRVHAACVKWTPGSSPDEICDPAGNGDVDLRDYRWTFRTLPQYSVVLYQPGGPLHVVTARNPAEGQIIAFDENRPVCLQTNQRRDQCKHSQGKLTIVIERL